MSMQSTLKRFCLSFQLNDIVSELLPGHASQSFDVRNYVHIFHERTHSVRSQKGNRISLLMHLKHSFMSLPLFRQVKSI